MTLNVLQKNYMKDPLIPVHENNVKILLSYLDEIPDAEKSHFVLGLHHGLSFLERTQEPPESIEGLRELRDKVSDLRIDLCLDGQF